MARSWSSRVSLVSEAKGSPYPKERVNVEDVPAEQTSQPLQASLNRPKREGRDETFVYPFA